MAGNYALGKSRSQDTYLEKRTEIRKRNSSENKKRKSRAGRCFKSLIYLPFDISQYRQTKKKIRKIYHINIDELYKYFLITIEKKLLFIYSVTN